MAASSGKCVVVFALLCYNVVAVGDEFPFIYSHNERIDGCDCYRAYFYDKPEAYEYVSENMADSLMLTMGRVQNSVLPKAEFIHITYDPNKYLVG